MICEMCGCTDEIARRNGPADERHAYEGDEQEINYLLLFSISWSGGLPPPFGVIALYHPQGKYTKQGVELRLNLRRQEKRIVRTSKSLRLISINLAKQVLGSLEMKRCSRFGFVKAKASHHILDLIAWFFHEPPLAFYPSTSSFYPRPRS